LSPDTSVTNGSGDYSTVARSVEERPIFGPETD
jgi:hypothetical protein